MAKSQTRFVCSSCGYTTGRWMGNCPSCSEWNTFVEEKVVKEKSVEHKARLETKKKERPKPQTLSEIDESSGVRLQTGVGELDRVLGGGFVPGSFVLLGGDPGVGKSTLTLQIAKENPGLRILYCSGEESAGQIKQRARRIGLTSENLLVFPENELGRILDQAQAVQPQLLVVDSIQTTYRPELQSMPGSINQIRECAAMLMQLAKQQNITTMAIGHITKGGDLAGPKLLEHIVDCVLQFEGDRNSNYRILRSLKNRFGPANEIGVFEMDERGLAEVPNPSQLFLSDHSRDVSGSAIVCTVEGSRPILLEIQALVTPANYGTPQRTASGFDQKRLSLLLAVLEKRAGYQFSGCDVFLNVAGGYRLSDPACDLGVVAALVSSLTDKSLGNEAVFIGEVGLGGEIRPVGQLERRVQEAQKMGFGEVFVPSQSNKTGKSSGPVIRIKSLEMALSSIL